MTLHEQFEMDTINKAIDEYYYLRAIWDIIDAKSQMIKSIYGSRKNIVLILEHLGYDINYQPKIPDEFL